MHRSNIDPRVIRVISWDVDGTLYSTRRLAAWVLASVVKGVVRRRDPRQLRDLRALWRYQEAVAAARTEGGAMARLLHQHRRAALLPVEQQWYGPGLARIGPRRGVVAALQAVAARGLLQVAVSDYALDYKLQALGLRPWIGVTLAGEELGFVKPHPEPFRRLVRLLGVPAHTILHVGDRAETDGAAALAAGCQVVILGRELGSISDVPRLLVPSHA